MAKKEVNVNPDLKEKAMKELDLLIEQHNDLVKLIQDSQMKLSEVKSMIVGKQGYLQGIDDCDKECKDA
tara:strand:+ start:1778 stop:1984 length:207 start_codon:yes stop_codon:yes gene_type:complete